MMIINPGSHIPRSTKAVGWTNTFEQAKAEAARWLKSIRDDDGMTDVVISAANSEGKDGRWSFFFHHEITGVTVELETHGIDDIEAYMKQCIFHPRIYWNGSSTGDPSIDDFAADGFRKIQTYVAIEDI